jgi:hypothetical protein
MIRMMVMVVMLGACSGMQQQSPRWPDHRKHHDEQLDQLEHEVAAQQAQITKLEERLGKLEHALPPPQ